MANKIPPEEHYKYQAGYGWTPGTHVVRKIKGRGDPVIEEGRLGLLHEKHPTAADYWYVSWEPKDLDVAPNYELVNLHELRLARPEEIVTKIDV